MNKLPEPRPDWTCSFEIAGDTRDDIWLARLNDFWMAATNTGFECVPTFSKKITDGKLYCEVKIPGNEMKKEGEA